DGSSEAIPINRRRIRDGFRGAQPILRGLRAGIVPNGSGTAGTASAVPLAACRLQLAAASVPYQQLRRRRVPAVAGVVQLRAVGDQYDDVHVREQFDVLAGGGDAV